jgi:predicted amidohydrolase
MRVGVIQLTSNLDPAINLKKIEGFLEQAKVENATHVFLPECFYSISNGQTPSPYLIEEDKDGPHYEAVKNLAKKFGIALIGGSAATKSSKGILNRSYNFDSKGVDLGHYDKIHLFACDLKNNKGEEKRIFESDIYTSGSELKLIQDGPLKVGLNICFDLRFSEMAYQYRKQGANLLTYPSAFTVPTGKAHWHTLNRARAIESQCFVIASAQWGQHNERIQTFGHSLVIDPWGEILADAGEGEKIVFSDLNLDRVDEVRRSVLMSRD